MNDQFCAIGPSRNDKASSTASNIEQKSGQSATGSRSSAMRGKKW